MVESAVPQGPSITPGSTGATIRASYVARDMTFYAIDRREIASISIMSALTLVFCSTGSFFLSLAIGLVVGRMFADKVTPAGELLASVGAGASVAIALVCFGLGGIVYLKRKGEIDAILSGPSTTTTVKVPTEA